MKLTPMTCAISISHLRRRATSLLLLILYIPHALSSLLRNSLVGFASPSIPPPPPLSMPVWSLTCPMVDKAGETSMNIVTFATPVSVAPPKLWIVSLYTNTLTRDSCLSSKMGVLQLMTPSMSDLVPILGKRSGYEEGYSKREECHNIGYEWVQSDSDFVREENGKLPALYLLPNCAVYIQLKLLSTTEAGDHDVVLCEVKGTGIWDVSRNKVVATDAPPAALDPATALYTAQLRNEGII